MNAAVLETKLKNEHFSRRKTASRPNLNNPLRLRKNSSLSALGRKLRESVNRYRDWISEFVDSDFRFAKVVQHIQKEQDDAQMGLFKATIIFFKSTQPPSTISKLSHEKFRKHGRKTQYSY